MGRKDSEWRPAHEESGWTEEHRAFRDWLIGELRTAGCEIRTLSPEGMAQVTVEHMVREGWEARRAVALNGAPDVAADLAALALARTLDEAYPSEPAQRRVIEMMDAAETREEYIARIRRQSMRDHPFEPSDDPRYCGHWSGSSRASEHGTLSFSSRCGYPRETHPPQA